MAKKLNSALGIDIGSRKIKFAEIKGSSKEPVVTALGIIDTPEGAVDHTGVYNSDAVGMAIKHLLAESGATSTHAVVSIAGQASVLVRTLEVPRMNPTELKQQMEWEINRNIPFAESTIVSDFRALRDDDPASQNMDVVMAISPQSAIDTIIACIKKAGKQMSAIDVEPLGIARSLTVSHDDTFRGKSVCVVEVGHKTTSINIYKDGKLLMPRTVPVGGELFTQAIADGMNVSANEAENIKAMQVDLSKMSGMQQSSPSFGGATQEFQAYNPFAEDGGFSNPVVPGLPEVDVAPSPAPEAEGAAAAMVPASSNTPAMNALAPAMDEFVAEVRRSIDYFRSRGGEVDALALCGGGSKIAGLSDFLGQSLGMPCHNLDPLRNLSINAKKADAQFIEQHKEEFAVAVGNGLHFLFD